MLAFTPAPLDNLVRVTFVPTQEPSDTVYQANLFRMPSTISSTLRFQSVLALSSFHLREIGGIEPPRLTPCRAAPRHPVLVGNGRETNQEICFRLALHLTDQAAPLSLVRDCSGQRAPPLALVLPLASLGQNPDMHWLLPVLLHHLWRQ